MGKIEKIINLINKKFIVVDFNELLDCDDSLFVLLSQKNIKNDYFNEPVELYEGLEVVVYMEDENSNGIRDDIFMELSTTKNNSTYQSN